MNEEEKKTSQKKAREYLKTIINKNSCLVININSVARSGMSRIMDVYVNDKNSNYLLWISADVSKLCNIRLKNNGLAVSGCGIDMTFWLADYITKCLYKDKKPKWLSGNGGTCLKWQSI